MDRSHLAPLLVATLAVLVLGVAAGSLNAVAPVGTQDAGSSAVSGNSGSDGSTASSDRPNSPGRLIDHPLFSELEVGGGVADRRIRSERFPTGVLLGVGLLILGVATVVFCVTGDDERAVTDSDPEPDVPEREPEQFTTRVTDPPPSNDVYRAWRTMIELADANETAGDTPAELARKATANGLPEGPVEKLTELFCAVRYGKIPPTDDREKRARTALEEIRRTSRSTDTAAPSSTPDT